MDNNGEIILYQSEDSTQIEVRIEEDTVWLTQAQMSDLFNTTRNNVTLHISKIFKEGELDRNSVSKESLLTAADGKRYKNLFWYRRIERMNFQENVFWLKANHNLAQWQRLGY